MGNAAEEILKIANGKDVDTLVIGSKGTYGTSKDMLGGTLQACSLLQMYSNGRKIKISY